MTIARGGDPLRHADGATRLSRREKLDTLHALRAELQDLQTLFADIRSGGSPLSQYADYVAKTTADVAQLMESVTAALPDGEIAEGDQVRHLLNQWEQMACSPLLRDPGGVMAPDQQVKQMELFDRQCREMVLQIGYLTIPARLNGWLARGWPGSQISFHEVFQDELPRPEDRQALLRWMANAPDVIEGGLIDPATGIISTFHTQRWKRVFTIGALALWFAALSAAVAISKPLTGLERNEALLQWCALILGVIVHSVVERGKEAQIGGRSAQIPMSRLSYRLDARSGVLLLRSLMMAVGYFGLIFLGKRENSTMLNMFLVGYGLDSFVGVFSAAIDKRAQARAAALKSDLVG